MVMLLLILIEDVSALLMLLKDCCRSAFHCYCVVVCISRLPLPLLMSDRVPVAAAVVFRLRLEGGCHGDKDIDRGRVDIVVDDKELLPVGVLRNCHVVVSKINKHALDCNCN